MSYYKIIYMMCGDVFAMSFCYDRGGWRLLNSFPWHYPPFKLYLENVVFTLILLILLMKIADYINHIL